MLKKYALIGILGLTAVIPLSGFTNYGVAVFRTPPIPTKDSVISLSIRLARIDALESQKDELSLTLQNPRLGRIDALELQKDAISLSLQGARLARIDALESQKDVISLSLQGARLARIDALELQKDVFP